MELFNTFFAWWAQDRTLLLTEAGILLFAVCFIFTFALISELDLQTLRFSFRTPPQVKVFLKFAYLNFFKPHEKNGLQGQQGALESFYRAQASIYDATRSKLLRGREDMLAMVAAQLKYQSSRTFSLEKPIWVDLGGGTGYNIEAMQAFLDVPNFFSEVYLVDFSPSLCEIARQRFERLGWKVHVICQDARCFRLPSQGPVHEKNFFGTTDSDTQAELITMSYSLSMMPDFHSVIDSVPALLKQDGFLGVIDFYVQSSVETSGRNYTGGCFNRHVNWLSRVFWRAWFDTDRVCLEAARRDYLEYRFGTLKTVDERNYVLGGIPYYIFLGRQRRGKDGLQDVLGQIDASCTESPFMSPRQHSLDRVRENYFASELKSKACQSAVINMNANLPLPSTFYQNTQTRIYYGEDLPKHTQFGSEYIYAFNWEDPRVDQEILRVSSEDTLLCITSAGDNVLDYLIRSNPRRIHAVDLNPNQNHLLELKTAAFQALTSEGCWRLFGEGTLPDFRQVLLQNLSPYLSSQTCQYWLHNASVFKGRGLYDTGGSRHAIRLVRWLLWLLGISDLAAKLCDCKTLYEQHRIWPRMRRVLMNKTVHWLVVNTEWFAWKAAGVPPPQRTMIQEDYVQHSGGQSKIEAIWEYMRNTFDPVVRHTLIGKDNYFYALCLLGKYTRRCHPEYMTDESHAKLSRPGAFDGLRIHTDEIYEVVARMAPESVNHAIIMDSMDWLVPGTQMAEAKEQAEALKRALKPGGKVLLRSAGYRPWYIKAFEQVGFMAKRAAVRLPGDCIDRVNMYASTWVLTKAPDYLQMSMASPQSPMSPRSPRIP